MGHIEKPNMRDDVPDVGGTKFSLYFDEDWNPYIKKPRRRKVITFTGVVTFLFILIITILIIFIILINI